MDRIDKDNPPVLSVAYWERRPVQEWRGYVWDDHPA